MRRIVVTCALLALLPAAALAQSAEPASTALDRWRPGLELDSRAGLDVATQPIAGSYDLWLTLGYVDNLLVVTDTTTGASESLVGPRWFAHVGGSAAVLPWLEVGADLPLVLYQARGGGTVAGLTTTGDLATAGMGDLSLLGKVALLRASRAGVDLALVAAATLPSHSPGDAYLGDDSMTVSGTLVASRKLLGGVELLGNLGYHWRPSRRFLDATIGPELRLAFGVGYDLRSLTTLPLDATLAWSTSARHDAPLRSVNETPSEVLLETTYRGWAPFAVSVGAGFGLAAGIGTPDARVFVGLRWAHRPADRDGEIPEGDSCRGHCAQLEEGRITTLDAVHFAVNEATLLPRSHVVLDEVADLLEEHPEIQKLRVEGHTDSEGNAQANLALSQSRANAVMRYLVSRGIDAERLSAKGYGETRPVAANERARGRSLNRRVEFVIEKLANE